MSEPIYRLPPFKVEKVLLATAETIDWGLKLLGIPPLWKETKGQGIKVGVLDTGIALEHPDLKPAILEARDFTRSPSDAYDAQGHGTHVCGIISARRNANGIVGVAPETQLLMAKVLNDEGSGTSADIVAGIRWAVEAGADILSMSLGSPEPDEEIHHALRDAIQKGVFVITAAGNEGPALDTVGYPAGFPEMVAVGSIDRQKKLSSFSSRGRQVDIVAPGDKITSCYPPRGYAVLSGTSMATPFVSGVVALSLAKHRKMGGKTPLKTQQDLIEHLCRTADDAGSVGFDPLYGCGIINPAKLIRG
ncbi:MAG: S8 family peptidase [Verrucomicrobia bacterium]|nr:S8 family peptidase [Verrucomicrobiota bacterium]